jgi:hypothetical protein
MAQGRRLDAYATWSVVRLDLVCPDLWRAGRVPRSASIWRGVGKKMCGKILGGHAGTVSG